MSKTLKIVLMVLVSLVVVAVLFGAGVMISRHAGIGFLNRQGFTERFEGRYFGMPMMGGGFGNHMPYGGFAFGGLFLLCRMFFRWLIPLALLALVIYAAYRWGRGKSSQAATVAPASVKTCANCGKVVQADWSHCPNCGTKQ